ncbi:MAG: YdcF family protein [Gemmatimonadales bacterium]|nr:YdcF family protein [Gemmatimonadales bacterium]
MVLALVGFAVSFGTVLFAAQLDERRPADAIVVLGAAQYNGRPSPVLQARLDHALRLYRDRLAPLVVVTGGTAPGDRMSEAEVGKRYLEAHGVPARRIAVRPLGHSTAASMQDVAAWAREAGADTLLFVSDPFHLARLRLEARRVGLAALVSPTRTSPISGNPRLELEYLLAEAVKLPVAAARRWDVRREK